MDIVTLNEESQSRWNADGSEHLRYEYDLTPDDLVIDIGAHNGDFSREIFKRYGCKIIAIEPTGYIDGFTEGDVIKQAASDQNGTMRFAGLSLYTSEYGPKTHEYPCFDVNELLRQHPKVALMKINIEGGEYRLLMHMTRGRTHKRVANLQVQFHQIEGCPWEKWYWRIARRLAPTHQLKFRYPFCWESWSRNA